MILLPTIYTPTGGLPISTATFTTSLGLPPIGFANLSSHSPPMALAEGCKSSLRLSAPPYTLLPLHHQLIPLIQQECLKTLAYPDRVPISAGRHCAWCCRGSSLFWCWVCSSSWTKNEPSSSLILRVLCLCRLLRLLNLGCFRSLCQQGSHNLSRNGISLL
jgi:hypothetical protein